MEERVAWPLEFAPTTISTCQRSRRREREGEGTREGGSEGGNGNEGEREGGNEGERERWNEGESERWNEGEEGRKGGKRIMAKGVRRRWGSRRRGGKEGDGEVYTEEGVEGKRSGQKEIGLWCAKHKPGSQSH